MVEWLWRYIIKCENWYCGRKYAFELKVRNVERVDFSCLQGQGQVKVVVFPNHLGELPSFSTWIWIVVASVLKGGDTIDQNTIHMYMPLHWKLGPIDQCMLLGIIFMLLLLKNI